jgi:archaellum component FlaF (FlaF/FlaG flagellin family)
VDKFREILAEIDSAKHPNQKYFIYKTIILNNLYGVDIMREAVEIAKLRLFLKLVAAVEADYRKPNLGLEPLPDIDFNIRSGNTLVGFATKTEIDQAFSGEFAFNKDELDAIYASCETLASEFKHFQAVQLTEGADGYSAKKIKVVVQQHLNELREKLNGYMALVYGIDPKNKGDYDKWRATHRPFHWFAEFYRIIALNGGFDVVIGNPPYVELRQINYVVKNLTTVESSAIHAMCIERAFELVNQTGNVSMIIPLALVCTQRMVPVQQIIEKKRAVWYANFAWRPAKLFDTVNRALTIFVSKSSVKINCYNTGYTKWNSDNRDMLFENIHYISYNEKRNSFWSPKLSSFYEISILSKISSKQDTLTNYIAMAKTENKLYYRTTGGLYWKVFTDKPPKFSLNGKSGSSSR